VTYAVVAIVDLLDIAAIISSWMLLLLLPLTMIVIVIVVVSIDSNKNGGHIVHMRDTVIRHYYW